MVTIIASITATATQISDSANPTIEPYTTGLTGIDQVANKFYHDLLFYFLAAVAVCVLSLRATELCSSWIRHKVTMGVKRQHYFAQNHSNWWPFVKRHILYAPIGSKRHNREIKLSSAVSVGTLPSRFQAVLLSVYFLSNLAFCAALDYTVENKWAIAAQLRGRSGTLAVMNMIPLILFATRNNPFIPLLKISFDTYNLLHRWMGRIVVVETVVHVLAWMVTQHASDGWSSIKRKTVDDPFIGWGMVGTIASILLLVHSLSPIRHAFYETFLNAHIILAAIFIATVWVHIDLGDLPQRPHCIVVIGTWVWERTMRLLRVALDNYSRGQTSYAHVEALPAEACLVRLQLPKYVDIKPGSHAYLRFPSLNVWDSHPFSIAWVSHKSSRADDENLLPVTENGRVAKTKYGKTTVAFIIQAQSGFTRKLYDATKNQGGHMQTSLLMEGPYGGHHCLDSYGHVVLFAGSSGITYQISYLNHLVREYAKGTIATRKVTLVWSVRESAQIDWVKVFMDDILRLPNRKELLNVKLHITRPKSPVGAATSSNTIQMYPGRPPITKILEHEVENQVGAMCVTVCGPGSLADSVRSEVRKLGKDTCIDFHEESFTW